MRAFLRKASAARTLLLVATALPCFGQPVEFGVKGGIPLTEAFETGSFFLIDFGEGATSATRRYTIGPTVETRLPHGFGVEFDVLYKRLGFDDLTKDLGVNYSHLRTSANSWEFPVLATFRLPHLLRSDPYLESGPSFRALSGVSATMTTTFFNGYLTTSSTSSTDGHLSDRSPYGVAAGAGLNLRFGRLHVSPEVRYTRWRQDRMLDPELYSNPNQVEVLLGLTF
jgi:hypothetical protein